jgi:hypothetical protein
MANRETSATWRQMGATLCSLAVKAGKRRLKNQIVLNLGDLARVKHRNQRPEPTPEPQALERLKRRGTAHHNCAESFIHFSFTGEQSQG